MKIKTSELEGAALDWAVAACEGYGDWDNEDPECMGFGSKNGEPIFLGILDFRPSSDWSRGGPIIEHAGIGLDYYPDGGHPQGGEWGALTNEGMVESFGPTPLIAAMRCLVSAKLGDEVEVPDDLGQHR